MKIIANVIGPTVNDDGTMDVFCSIGYAQSGVANNLGIHVTVTIPTILTALTLNEAIQTAISNYMDANYGTSTTLTDVILLSGVTNI